MGKIWCFEYINVKSIIRVLFSFRFIHFLSSSYQNWEFLTEFWNRTYSIWSLTIRLTHFQHAGIFGIKKQLRQVLFSMYFFRYVLGHIITLVLLCLVSERTYACTHPSYVYVCACLFIFLFALLLLFSCCGDPMPLFSNTGEKLNFLAAADSVSLVSLSLTKPWNFIQFHLTMWNHHHQHHLYRSDLMDCEVCACVRACEFHIFLFSLRRPIESWRLVCTHSHTQTHTHVVYIWFSKSDGLLQLTHAAAAATFTRLKCIFMSQSHWNLKPDHFCALLCYFISNV